MRILLLSIAILCFLPNKKLLAQQQNVPAYQLELDRAEAAYRSKKYNTAALLFQKVYPKVKQEEEKQKILFKIADSYRNSNNFKQALKWYEDVVNSKYPDPFILYSYGQLLKNFERYDDANRVFYDYTFEAPEDPKGKLAMQSCAISAEWKANPLKFKVENVTALNSDQSDYAPFVSSKGLYLTSTRKEAQGSEVFEWTGQKYCDIFLAQFSGDGFAKPEAIKSLNSNYNEGVTWLDSNESMVLFTQCNGKDGAGLFCKVLVSYFQNGVWVDPKPLPINSDSFSIGHPAFSMDGKRLYFSSDMPGGFGNKDIWYIDYNPVKDTWGNPVNLGPNVNSSEDELFPYVDENGEIYFSSKGFYGMGGLDLYKTADSAGTFKVAQNLQSPINSGADDFGISFIKASLRQKGKPFAYFTSNREGGVGDDDIYSISDKPVIVLVKGTVIERESATPLAGASIETISQNGQSLWKIKTNEKGAFSAELPLNDVPKVSASLDKYLSSNPQLCNTNGIVNDTTILLNFVLDLIPPTDVELTMQGIYYDLDKWNIREDAAKVLDSMAQILKANPNLVVELASHTDSRAPAEYNLDLSNKRAKSCVEYLISKGIAKDRLVPVGFGETKLVNDCSDEVDCSEEEHQQNRRTTVRVIKTDYKQRR
jgi:outer membrane protein OmpA-like peptidoglycan-associated protein